MILLTLLDKTLAIEIKYLFGSKKKSFTIPANACNYVMSCQLKKSLHYVPEAINSLLLGKTLYILFSVTFHCILNEIDISNESRIMHTFTNIEMLLWNYDIILPTGHGFVTNANKNLFLYFLYLESKPYTCEFSV